MTDVQEDLYRLEDWQQKWKMEFNPSKCKIMCFTTRRDPPKREYVFCGQILEEVESHPYLGVVLDKKMRCHHTLKQSHLGQIRSWDLSSEICGIVQSQ